MANWRYKDITGQKFGRWTALSTKYEKNKYGYCLWSCICECGTFRNVPTSNLKSGNSMSCGCLTKDKAKLGLSRLGRGGQKMTPEYCKRMSDRMKAWVRPSDIGAKISKAKKGKKVPKLQGANNPKWIPDRSKLKRYEGSRERGSPASLAWSRDVKNRDGWKCKIANGDCSGRLESHHILSWKDHPELRYQLNNGITLCHFHHPRKRADEMRLSPYFKELVGKAT